MAWIGGILSAGVGIAQLIGASNTEIDERKEIKPTSAMLRAERMAERRAKEGLSASERVLYEQGQAARASASERKMRNLGLGVFAPSLSAMYDVQGSNQLAALSEQERRRGEQQYASIAGQLQSVADREAISFNQMVTQQEQALGQAYASGASNLMSGISTMASGLRSMDKGSEPGGDAPEGTTSGVNASGEAISMSPNYDPSTDAMSGGFQSDFGGNTPAGTNMDGSVFNSNKTGGVGQDNFMFNPEYQSIKEGADFYSAYEQFQPTRSTGPNPHPKGTLEYYEWEDSVFNK